MKWKDRKKVSKWSQRNDIDSKDPLVIQEMHPEISTSDRMKVKNLSNSPEDALNFLRKQYPDLQVGLQNGQIVAKKDNEENYKVLDPDTGILSSDILSDLGDVAYDVPAALAEGAATIAGGVAGFGAGGIGAIPGAMAAGAASGATTEGIKQALGKYLGVNNNFDAGSVATNAVASGASPLLLGVGGLGLKQAAKAGINQAAFNQAGKGVVQRGLGKIGSKIGTAITGVPEEAIEYYSKNMSKVDSLNEEKKFELLKSLRNRTSDVIDSRRKSVGKKIGSTYDSMLEDDLVGELRFPIEEVKQSPLIDLLGKREAAKRTNNPAIKQAYKNARGQYMNTFKGMDDAVGSDLVYLKDSLKDISRSYKQPGVRFSGKEGAADKTLSNAYARSYGAFNDVADKLGGGSLKPLNRQYKSIIDDGKDVSKILKNEESADRLLRNLGKNTKDVARQKIKTLDSKYGTGIERNAKLINAYQYFNNPGLSPISSGGATSTSRTLMGQGLGGLAGAAIGSQSSKDGNDGALIGGLAGAALGSPYALKQIIKANKEIGKKADALVPVGIRRNTYGDILESLFEN